MPNGGAGSAVGALRLLAASAPSLSKNSSSFGAATDRVARYHALQRSLRNDSVKFLHSFGNDMTVITASFS